MDFNKEHTNEIERIVTNKVGYYSYIQNNLLDILELYSHSITTFAKDNEMLFELTDNELKAKTSLFFFEQLASQIYTEDKYLTNFKRKDWIEHTVFAFNHQRTNIERLKELKKFFKPE